MGPSFNLMLRLHDQTNNRTSVNTDSTFLEEAVEAELIAALRELIVRQHREGATAISLLGNSADKRALAVVNADAEVVSRLGEFPRSDDAPPSSWMPSCIEWRDEAGAAT